MIKHSKAKDLDSIKSFIISYISLKILNSEFKTNHHVPSENVIAKKFNCSRLTARSAIIVLVHLGILYAIKGSGHYVSENAIKILLPTLFVSKKSNIINNEFVTENNLFVECKSIYFTDNKVIGECLWKFDKTIYKNQIFQYENLNDYSVQLINAGLIGIKVIESLKIINNKTYIVHKHYNEKNDLIFEFCLWYEDIETISEKVYFKM